jgi:hypothetical protein
MVVSALGLRRPWRSREGEAGDGERRNPTECSRNHDGFSPDARLPSNIVLLKVKCARDLDLFFTLTRNLRSAIDRPR